MVIKPENGALGAFSKGLGINAQCAKDVGNWKDNPLNIWILKEL
jgi:hypothetical protein